MKVSVSLPADDIEFLDEYGPAVGAPSRSAVLHRAVQLLRAAALGSDYAQAWGEWEAEGQSEVWESVVGDGLDDPGNR